MGQLEKNDYGLYESVQETISIDISDASEFLLKNTERYRSIDNETERLYKLISDFNDKYNVNYSEKDIESYFLRNNFYLEIRLNGWPIIKKIVDKKTLPISEVESIKVLFPEEAWNAIKKIRISINYIHDPEWSNQWLVDEYDNLYLNSARLGSDLEWKSILANEVMHIVLLKLWFSPKALDWYNFLSSDWVKQYLKNTNIYHIHEVMSDIASTIEDVNSLKDIIRFLIYMSWVRENRVITHTDHNYSYSWYFLREQIFQNKNAIVLFVKSLEIASHIIEWNWNIQELEKSLDDNIQAILDVLVVQDIQTTYLEHWKELLEKTILPVLDEF